MPESAAMGPNMVDSEVLQSSSGQAGNVINV